MYVGVFKFDNNEFKPEIYNDFVDLYDALDCCIASSHIPLMSGTFLNYYRDVQAQAKDKLKTDKAKDKRDELVQLMGKTFSDNMQGIQNILAIHNMTIAIKSKLLKQINSVKATQQFIKTDNGFEVTNPEGYVAIDNDGQAKSLLRCH